MVERHLAWEGKAGEFKEAMSLLGTLLDAFASADQRTKASIAEDAGITVSDLDDRVSLAEDVAHGLKMGKIDHECEFPELSIVKDLDDLDDEGDDEGDDEDDEEGDEDD
jgi:hypothetical protein